MELCRQIYLPLQNYHRNIYHHNQQCTSSFF